MTVSEWWGAMPPPDGVQPNFVDPPDQKRMNVSAHAVCLSLVTIFLSIRLYTRHFITHTTGWDDSLLVLSFCLSVTFSGLVIKSYEWGFGRHMWDVPKDWVPQALELSTIAAWIYVLLGTSYRLAILFVYHRIFTINPRAKLFIRLGIAFISVVNFIFLFVMIYACNPPRKAWDPLAEGECMNPRPLSYFSGSLNVFEDMYVFVLPLPFVWGMKMGTMRKARLFVVFGLGLFAMVASVVRLAETKELVSTTDTSYNFARIGFWAVIEVNVSILCACLTVLPAFFERHWPKIAARFGSQNPSRAGAPSERRGQISVSDVHTRNAKHTIGGTSRVKQAQLRSLESGSMSTSDENLTQHKGPVGQAVTTHHYHQDLELDEFIDDEQTGRFP